MGKLFIGGLSGDVQEMDIAILVSLHGDLKAIKVVRDRKTGKCKGYAFLDIATETDEIKIIDALNGRKFHGNVITVKKMEEQDVKASPAPKRIFKSK